jgi:hypothetical protein
MNKEHSNLSLKFEFSGEICESPSEPILANNENYISIYSKHAI